MTWKLPLGTAIWVMIAMMQLMIVIGIQLVRSRKRAIQHPQDVDLESGEGNPIITESRTR